MFSHIFDVHNALRNAVNWPGWRRQGLSGVEKYRGAVSGAPVLSRQLPFN
jgi:hypothetical protein